MQGCPLRCVCCQNPDTWDMSGGKEMSVDEMLEKIRRLKGYFGKNGGITVSGGEPLMQAGFVKELFAGCRAEGISCALDTSGCILNKEIEELLELCDIVLLDYKYTTAGDYVKNVGCSIEKVDAFLNKLEQMNKRVWLRQVIIPGLNDNEESVGRLYDVANAHRCVEKVELLPFRKLCIEKYKDMGIAFPLADVPEADAALISRLQDVKFDRK